VQGGFAAWPQRPGHDIRGRRGADPVQGASFGKSYTHGSRGEFLPGEPVARQDRPLHVPRSRKSLGTKTEPRRDCGCVQVCVNQCFGVDVLVEDMEGI